MLRSILARIAWALAGIGASRAATSAPSESQGRVEAVDSVREEWAVEEQDTVLRPSFHAEFHARYKGPVASALEVEMLTRRTLGVAEEYEQFVAERTR